jgi:hypothetical protein
MENSYYSNESCGIGEFLTKSHQGGVGLRFSCEMPFGLLTPGKTPIQPGCGGAELSGSFAFGADKRAVSVGVVADGASAVVRDCVSPPKNGIIMIVAMLPLTP